MGCRITLQLQSQVPRLGTGAVSLFHSIFLVSMFSNIVTAAKGLFARHESQSPPADSTGATAATTSDMVTATRRGTVTSNPTEEPNTNGAAKQGKRKAQPVATEKTNDKQSKRRKRNSVEAEITTMEESSADESAPKKHFRFGSEDPEPSVPETLPESIPAKPEQDEDEDSDSDDDAPETIDNSAQLLKIKEQARKQEKAKQQYVSSPSWPLFFQST